MKSLSILVILLPFVISCGGSDKSKNPVTSSRVSALEIKTTYSSTRSTIKLSSLVLESSIDCGLQVGPEEVYEFEVTPGKIKLTDARSTSITFTEKPEATTLLYTLESSTDSRLKSAELEMPDSRTIRIKMECRE